MNLNLSLPEWLVIVNPNAGNGKGKKDWNRISDLLGRNNISCDYKITGRKGDATDFTTEAIAKGFRKIITVGGDGTLNEVVNGVMSSKACPSAEVTLALIPVGTGNDWGRMFGIPLDHEKAIEIIGKGKNMLHDIGLLSYFDGKIQKHRYFINIAGLGFESVVVKRTNYQKDRGRGGKLIYFYNLLMSLLTYKNTTVEITIDGRTTSDKIFSINVGNGRYCGGGMRQTPDALPNDGLLDVSVLRNIGKIEVIRNLKILYDGTILSHPKIDGYRCRNIRVTSNSPVFTEADGETLGHTPAEFSIIPLAIKIIYGTEIIQ